MPAFVVGVAHLPGLAAGGHSATGAVCLFLGRGWCGKDRKHRGHSGEGHRQERPGKREGHHEERPRRHDDLVKKTSETRGGERSDARPRRTDRESAGNLKWPGWHGGSFESVRKSRIFSKCPPAGSWAMRGEAAMRRRFPRPPVSMQSPCAMRHSPAEAGRDFRSQVARPAPVVSRDLIPFSHEFVAAPSKSRNGYWPLRSRSGCASRRDDERALGKGE